MGQTLSDWFVEHSKQKYSNSYGIILSHKSWSGSQLLYNHNMSAYPQMSLNVVLFICLFVCLGRLCFGPPLHLYLLPWQQSSRDTQLSSNPLPQPAQPTDCCRGVSLFDMPEQHWQRAPLGGCYDITGCLGDSLVAAPLCSALARFNSSYGSSEH